MEKLHFRRASSGKSESKELAKKFRTLMGCHALTLQDIAKKTGNAVSTVSTWRRGQIPRNEKTRQAVAKILGVNAEFLYSNKILDEELVFSNESPIKTESSARESRKIFEEILIAAKKKKGGLATLKSKLTLLREEF